MNPIQLHRHDIALLPESTRVLIRSFIPGSQQRVTAILGRVLALTEDEVVRKLQDVHHEFDSRHYEIDALLWEHYLKVRPAIFTQRELSRARQLLIGAFFSGEYSLESAALFNPSIVPHPDQSELPHAGLRFIMSLRATGEGHISSIEFRSGRIDANGEISLDPISRSRAPLAFTTMPAGRSPIFDAAVPGRSEYGKT